MDYNGYLQLPQDHIILINKEDGIVVCIYNLITNVPLYYFPEDPQSQRATTNIFSNIVVLQSSRLRKNPYSQFYVQRLNGISPDNIFNLFNPEDYPTVTIQIFEEEMRRIMFTNIDYNRNEDFCKLKDIRLASTIGVEGQYTCHFKFFLDIAEVTDEVTIEAIDEEIRPIREMDGKKRSKKSKKSKKRSKKSKKRSKKSKKRSKKRSS